MFDACFVLIAMSLYEASYFYGWVAGSEVKQTSTLMLILIAIIFFGDKNFRREWKEAGQFYVGNDVEEMLTSKSADVREYGLVISGHKKDTFADYVPWFIRDRFPKKYLHHTEEDEDGLQTN
jgi:hypothetical protein